MRIPMIAAGMALAASLAVAGCQTDPRVAAFLGTNDRCQQFENVYVGFRVASGNKSTRQIEAFMAGIRAARKAGSDCKTFNMAQLAQAIAEGKAVLGVK